MKQRRYTSPVNHSEINYGPVENSVERIPENPRQDIVTNHNSQHGGKLKASPTSHANLNKNLLIDLDNQNIHQKEFQLLNAQFDNLIGQNNFIDEQIMPHVSAIAGNQSVGAEMGHAGGSEQETIPIVYRTLPGTL